MDSVGPVGSISAVGSNGQAVSLREVDSLPAPANTAGGQDQLIAADDVLMVDVFEVDQLDRTAQVDARGFISLPLVGSVKAAGKTLRQLETRLETDYRKRYLQNPDVSVQIKGSSAQRVTVDGEIAKSGSFPVSSSTTLMQVVAQAGGFTQIADPSKVYVYRQFNDEKLVAKFDVAAIRAARRADPRIYGGDIVMVFSSDTRVAAQNLREALGLATGAARTAVVPGF